jgi:hypothetical protein
MVLASPRMCKTTCHNLACLKGATKLTFPLPVTHFGDTSGYLFLAPHPHLKDATELVYVVVTREPRTAEQKLYREKRKQGSERERYC